MLTLDVLTRRWELTPDGPAWATASSLLLPVRDRNGAACIVKWARIAEEIRGGRTLVAWAGRGTVPVLRREDAALLMPRARGGDLVARTRAGGDDEALDRIADVARDLHGLALDRLEGADWWSLDRWFAALRRIAGGRGGMWARAWDDASALLASAPAEVALHGDLHHGNVLDFGPPDTAGIGWRAIDPKGLRGDPAFDLVAALLNPDRSAQGGDPQRMRRRAERLSARGGYDVDRVLAWTEAFATLSAAWAIEAAASPARDLAWRTTAQASRRA